MPAWMSTRPGGKDYSEGILGSLGMQSGDCRRVLGREENKKYFWSGARSTFCGVHLSHG